MGTWLIGHVSTADAQATLREEGELLRILDAAASSPEEFEELASAIEANELDKVADPLRLVATEHGIEELLDEGSLPSTGWRSVSKR